MQVVLVGCFNTYQTAFTASSVISHVAVSIMSTCICNTNAKTMRRLFLYYKTFFYIFVVLLGGGCIPPFGTLVVVRLLQVALARKQCKVVQLKR